MAEQNLPPVPKVFWKSRSLWFNVLAGALTIFIVGISNTKVIPLEYATPIILIGNIVLRLLTSQPLTLK